MKKGIAITAVLIVATAAIRLLWLNETSVIASQKTSTAAQANVLKTIADQPGEPISALPTEKVAFVDQAGFTVDGNHQLWVSTEATCYPYNPTLSTEGFLRFEHNGLGQGWAVTIPDGNSLTLPVDPVINRKVFQCVGTIHYAGYTLSVMPENLLEKQISDLPLGVTGNAEAQSLMLDRYGHWWLKVNERLVAVPSDRHTIRVSRRADGYFIIAPRLVSFGSWDGQLKPPDWQRVRSVSFK